MGEKKHRIIKDPEYGFLRTDPVPAQEEVEKYYREEFYANYRQFNDSSLEVQEEERDFFNSRWEAICRKCRKYFGKLEGVSVFDVGCGFSQALLYFRERKMTACGLEPAPEGVEYAHSRGLTVHRAGIEEFSCVGEERFDVVTLINVLEHLRDPARTLINIRQQLLRSGGLLVIDVPNDFNDFQVAADEEYRLDQWWVCPPNHINYFSCSSLASLLQRTGYEIVHREATFPLEMFLLMGDVYVGDGALGKQCHEKRVRFEHLLKKHRKEEKLMKFYEALAELDLGRQIVVYATPAARPQNGPEG